MSEGSRTQWNTICFRRNKAQEDFNSFALAVEIFMPLRNSCIARDRLQAYLVPRRSRGVPFLKPFLRPYAA